MRTALITGSLGQDGSYLTEYLLEKGYRVFCGHRRLGPSFGYTKHSNQEFVFLDVRDELSIRAAIKKSWPDEIYNLAGQVYVPLSWEKPADTFDVNTSGLARILKVVEEIKTDTRIYQASSSEMFGNHEGSCRDTTPMYPTSPYGVSKFAAHKLVDLYRDRGLYVVAGILFNHESPRRGHEMVTRKIARHVALWALGSNVPLRIGSLDSRRDWGFAGEYIKAMHLMLQAEKATDYVVGTGESYSVGDFLSIAAEEMEIDKLFVRNHLEIDGRFLRTQEIYSMRADNSKIKELLNWEPQMSFRELVKLMVRTEYTRLKEKGENNEQGHSSAGEHNTKSVAFN